MSSTNRSTNLETRSLPKGCSRINGLTWFARPGDGTLPSGEMVLSPETPECSPYAAASPGSKQVPSASIRCMTTASLRAKATLAFFMPARQAIFAAQLLS